jgi:hypothetical protein
MLRSIILPFLIASAGLATAADPGVRSTHRGDGHRHGAEGAAKQDATGAEARQHLRGVMARHHLLMVAKFDTDGDHRLSEAERATAKAWFEQQRAAAGDDAQRPGGSRPERGDGDKPRRAGQHDGEAADAAASTTVFGAGKDGESGKRHLRGVLRRVHLLMLDRFDADGDRRLSDTERATAKAWFEAQRAAHREAHGHRQDGDGGPGATLDAGERAALAPILGDDK